MANILECRARFQHICAVCDRSSGGLQIDLHPMRMHNYSGVRRLITTVVRALHVVDQDLESNQVFGSEPSG